MALTLITASCAFPQGIITTVAGGSGFLDNIPATEARITGPNGLAVDAHGNAYIGDGNRVRRIDSVTGIISTAASIPGVFGIAPGANGKLVVASNTTGSQVQLLDPATGVVTNALSGAMPADAILDGLATDSGGNIFVSDGYNDKIYRIDAVTGALTTFAGGGTAGGEFNAPIGDGGPATQAVLGRPAAITVDPSGNVFVTEQYWLRRIDAKTGIITSIAPNSGAMSSGDGGPYANAVFSAISALATDAEGNLYISDHGHIREINWTSGLVSAVPATGVTFSIISAMVVDAQGNLWIADAGNARVFLLSPLNSAVATVAGTSQNGDGGLATGALITGLNGLAINSQGDMYFVAGGLRRVDHATQTITTIAFSNTEQPLMATGNLALDSAGNIYVSQSWGLSRVDAESGAVTTVAGGGSSLGDGGPATEASVNAAGAAIDSSGNIYIADNNNERIRRVDAATGIITTAAGNGQGQLYSGETGVATQISIGLPEAIAIGPDGNIYWTTPGWVLKMTPAGNLSVAAGNGGCAYAGDGGPALQAPLCYPQAIAFDPSGDLFITETNCHCVRRVDAVTGIIQTIAGTGVAGASADNITATQAALNPGAIAWFNGILYIDDAPQSSNPEPRVRAVNPPTAPPLPQPPVITSITNAIDYRQNFAPGAIVSLFGNYLGGATPVSGQFGADGRVTTSLAGTQVTFNSIATPILYISAGQINTIIPFEIQGYASPVNIELSTPNGTSSSGISTWPIALGLFANLAVNPDGTLNSASNPAPQGATLVLYGTGMGQTNPSSTDGAIAQGPPFATPGATFMAIVGQGVPNAFDVATVQYIGPLPDFVNGAVQVNVQLPPSLPSGKYEISVFPVGDASAGSAGTTIYIQ